MSIFGAPLIDMHFGGATPIQIRFGLERWVRLLDSLEPAFRDCIPVLESHMERVFAAEGARNVHGRWALLSAQYARQKLAYHWPGKTILTRSGWTRHSLTVPGFMGALRQTDSTHLVFGTAVPYARYHQDGGGRLPQRRIFDFATDIRDRRSVGWAITQVFQAHVVYARGQAFEQANPGSHRTLIPPARVVARLRGMELH